jgi:hypothetical protein
VRSVCEAAALELLRVQIVCTRLCYNASTQDHVSRDLLFFHDSHILVDGRIILAGLEGALIGGGATGLNRAFTTMDERMLRRCRVHVCR